jgi:nitrite reductase/ring-hydroxylating ferredoxin subunit
MANFVKVAQTDEIPAGQGKCVEVNGQRIAIFNVDGTFYAIDDVCQHQGGPLGEGEVDGKIVTCPRHGWEYDVTTGANTLDDDLKQEQFEVQVNGNVILVGV